MNSKRRLYVPVTKIPATVPAWWEDLDDLRPADLNALLSDTEDLALELARRIERELDPADAPTRRIEHEWWRLGQQGRELVHSISRARTQLGGVRRRLDDLGSEDEFDRIAGKVRQLLTTALPYARQAARTGGNWPGKRRIPGIVSDDRPADHRPLWAPEIWASARRAVADIEAALAALDDPAEMWTHRYVPNALEYAAEHLAVEVDWTRRRQAADEVGRQRSRLQAERREILERVEHELRFLVELAAKVDAATRTKRKGAA